MFLLLLGIGVIITIIGAIIGAKDHCAFEGAIAGIVISVIALVGCLVIWIVVSNGNLLPEKIALQEEYISELKEMTNEIISNYTAYEGDVFGNADGGEGANVYATGNAFPQLAGSELFEEQFKLLTKAEKKLLALKKSYANLSVWKWWLTFGF